MTITVDARLLYRTRSPSHPFAMHTDTPPPVAPNSNQCNATPSHLGRELLLQPALVGDDVGGADAADLCVEEVGDLGGGVVAPHAHVGHAAGREVVGEVVWCNARVSSGCG